MGGGPTGERFLSHLVSGVRVVRAWRNLVPHGGWRACQVHVGTLPDGRWWVQRTDGPWCYAYPSEGQAQAAAETLMVDTGDEWVPVSPHPTQDDPRWRGEPPTPADGEE